jgi:hypothetical protein
MEDINGLKIDLEMNKCILWHKFNKFAPIVIDVPDRLIEVTDYSWMRLDKWDEEAIHDRIRDKSMAMRSEYIRGVTSEAMLEQVRVLTEENGEAWMTEERQDGIVGAYLARADALELLHIRLGHMPYQRIERMIRRQIIKGYKLDSKTLKALLRERCDVCIRSKKVDAPHKGQLPLPKTPLVNFSTDLSAAFDRPSLYGNIYQMVIIDNKSKYVWDYYLKSKDQAFDKIKEWLENEIGLLRGERQLKLRDRTLQRHGRGELQEGDRHLQGVRCSQATDGRLHTRAQCICRALVSYE